MTTRDDEFWRRFLEIQERVKSLSPDQLEQRLAELEHKAYAAWKISGATVTVSPGGLSAKTTSTGKYAVKVRPGTYTIKIVKTGYATATIKKRVSANTAANVAAAPVKPVGATARCKDRTWSKSQNRSGTCSRHKASRTGCVQESSAIEQRPCEKPPPGARF